MESFAWIFNAKTTCIRVWLVYIYYSIDKAKIVLADAGLKTPVLHASDFSDLSASNATVIVLEHHPLVHKEDMILSASYP